MGGQGVAPLGTKLGGVANEHKTTTKPKIMANNRMYLMHRPSRKAVYLGKRMGFGWYSVPDDVKERIEALFEMSEKCSDQDNQDDFCVAMEDGESATLVDSSWQYGEKDERGIISLPNRI